MRLKNKMLAVCSGVLFITTASFAQADTLKDINYNFDQTKVAASADAFHFLRSFVDYYFQLIAQNKNSLNIVKKAGSFSGWCVGDAHAENFGILLQENGSALFTMNDMDDSGPCPVAYDLLRILVSSRSYMPKIDTQDILKSYKDGLKGKSASFPDSIKSMTKDALKVGFSIDLKDLNGNMFKRKSSMTEVDAATKTQISSLLQSNYKNEGLRLLDIVATSKVDGGSGGLQRFEMLITNTKNEVIHLEFKELVTPSISSVASGPIPTQLERMKRSLQIDQGASFSHY